MKILDNKRKGISLIELVLALAILSIVIQGVYSIFFVGQKSFATGKNKGFAQQGVRVANAFLSEDLKYSTSFITNENFDSGITNSKVYSVQLEDSDLIQKDYTYTNPGYTETEIKRISGNWEGILLANDEYGILNVYIKQEENSMNLSSEYVLDYSIELVNSPLIKTEMEWNFMNGDILYYTVSRDTEIGSIKLNDINTGGNNGGGNGAEGDIGVIDIDLISVQSKSGNEYTNLTFQDGYYLINKNQHYEISYKIKSKINNNIKRTFENSSFTINATNNDTLVKISQQSSNSGVGHLFSVILEVTDRNIEEEIIGRGTEVINFKHLD